ncbi:MAG: hypothetical protein WD034_06130 [Parvibaculum sp.]|uniref:hypothetical protein n=1 Tax=Parvibaculum sp. TaxID=2024848 RepID=UPI0034A02F11
MRAKMWVLRVVLAFVLAVIVATVLGAVAHTQFVLARLSGLGVDISLGERLSTTLHDIVGMAPLFGAIVGSGFIVAMAAAALVYRLAGIQRTLIYTVAGAISLCVTLLVMNSVFEITAIAGARSTLGFLAQMAAGAVGGLTFAKALPAR